MAERVGSYPASTHPQITSKLSTPMSGGEGGIDSGHPGPRPSGAVAKTLRRPAPPLRGGWSNPWVRTPPLLPRESTQLVVANSLYTQYLAERVGFEPTNTVRC